jgi:hypothetical protein
MLGKKQGRVYYMLLSPSLMNMFTSCHHLHQGWSLTDHSSVNATFRLERTKEGPGVFRAMPGIQNRGDYDALMRHLVTETLVENSRLSMEEKSEELNRSLSILKLQQKTEAQTITEWEMEALAIQLSLQRTKKELLATPQETSMANLLDFILLKLGNATKQYQRTLK